MASEEQDPNKNLYKGFGDMQSDTPIKSRKDSALAEATKEITEGLGAFKLQETQSQPTLFTQSNSAKTSFASGLQFKSETEASTEGRDLFGAGSSGTYSSSKSSIKPSVKFNFTQYASKHETKPNPVKTEKEDVKLSHATVISTPTSAGLKSSRPAALKYALFCIPADGLKQNYCLSYKGQGSSFCLKTDCSTNHSGSGQAEVKPNHGYVMKLNTNKNQAATDNPEINLKNLSEKFREEIMSTEKPMDEWMELAIVLECETDSDPSLSEAEYFSSKNTARMFKDWQSPMVKRRHRVKTEVKIESLEVPEYDGLMPDYLTQIIICPTGERARALEILRGFYAQISTDYQVNVSNKK